MLDKKENSTLNRRPKWYWSAILLLFAIFFFLFSIDMVGASLTMVGRDTAESILLATSNPFIGLFIGLLTTALIQSSSTVTAMTVAVVASGYISLGNAIPIVMGANIGTTLTSTLVSLGFITNKTEFRKAISAGTVHDFFNIIVVVLLFPLEYYYGFLSRIAVQLTSAIGELGLSNNKELGSLEYNLSSLSRSFVSILPDNFLTIILSLVLLFLSIKLLSQIIYSQLIGESKDRLTRYIFDNPYKSFGWGVLITGGIQSSSITTSLMVPLVASGKVKLSNSFPFIMGANIGTTITALLAAFNKTDAAISLALVHVTINMIGVLIFLPFPALRRIPVLIAYKFGALTLESRAFGFSYILFTFFLLPFTLIYINKDTIETRTYTYTITDWEQNQTEGIIVMNTNKGKNKAHFAVYNNREWVTPINTIPDTSFEANLTEKTFVSFDGLARYKSQKVSGKDLTGSYALNVVKDTTMASPTEEGELELLLLEKRYNGNRNDCSKARILIDPKLNLVIEADYFDDDNRLIRHIRLHSVK